MIGSPLIKASEEKKVKETEFLTGANPIEDEISSLKRLNAGALPQIGNNNADLNPNWSNAPSRILDQFSLF